MKNNLFKLPSIYSKWFLPFKLLSNMEELSSSEVDKERMLCASGTRDHKTS